MKTMHIRNNSGFSLGELITVIGIISVLGVIAVPLSYTSPRQGRYARMFSAMLIFLIYSNFLNVARSWLEKGQVPPALGLWWVHGVMLLVAVVLWQIRGGSGLALRRHRR